MKGREPRERGALLIFTLECIVFVAAAELLIVLEIKKNWDRLICFGLVILAVICFQLVSPQCWCGELDFFHKHLWETEWFDLTWNPVHRIFVNMWNSSILYWYSICSEVFVRGYRSPHYPGHINFAFLPLGVHLLVGIFMEPPPPYTCGFSLRVKMVCPLLM